MESRAKLFGHSIHQMLIVFPLGLLITSVVFDVIYLVTGNGAWAGIAYWMIIAGLIGGLLAAIFGVIDWTAIPAGTRAKAIGVYHAVLNVGVMVLFFISWFLRQENPQQIGKIPILLSFLAVGIGSVAAWFGGELVSRLGVGVDDGAHLNSPNSMSGHPAYEQVPEPGVADNRTRAA